MSESAHGSPTPSLRDLIAGYDGYRQRGVAPARHLGLPSPFMTLIFTLDEALHLAEHVDRSRPPASYESLVGGLHATPVVIAHDGAQSGIQLRVSPIASRALFGMPAGELARADVAAAQVIGRLADELHERLSATTDWAGRFAILDAMLSDRARRGERSPPAPVINAWNLLMLSHGSMPISRLAREVGWSERQLAKQFDREVGMSPKLAARVIRFDRARRTLQAQRVVDRRTDIARLAAECGYHDQPHLIRDFRSFTGLAPSRWLSQEFGNVQAHAPVDA